MDVEARIAALTDVTAKGALLWILKRDAFTMKLVNELGMDEEKPIKDYEHQLLDKALKEAQDGHKSED